MDIQPTSVKRWLMACIGGLTLLLSPAARAATGQLDRILSSGEMRVCIWPDYYGSSYRNPHSQQLTGLDVDMARAFAKDLGVVLRFVDTTFVRLIDDVTQDRCDIAMFAIAITPPRAEKLRFTRAHLQVGTHAITTRNNRRIRNWSDIDQPGVVVAVLRASSNEAVMREMLKAATVRAVDSAGAREIEVESGRADVFIANYLYSRRMLDQVDWARVISPPATLHATPVAYAVRPGDDAWHARAEQFVAAIQRDGRLQASARRHKLETLVARP